MKFFYIEGKYINQVSRIHTSPYVYIWIPLHEDWADTGQIVTCRKKYKGKDEFGEGNFKGFSEAIESEQTTNWELVARWSTAR